MAESSDSDAEAGKPNRICQMFSCSTAAVMAEGPHGEHYVIDYDITKVSTFAVFCMVTGTVMKYKILWCQTVFIMLVFFGVAFGLQQIPHGIEKYGVDPDQAEKFVKATTLLATFLLGFYTSISYGRWWNLRGACGQIAAAAGEITVILSQTATKDRKVLDSVNRYCRASLVLISIRQQFKDRKMNHYKRLVNDNILDADELAQLKKINGNYAQSIWTWIAAIVESERAAGRINGEGIHAGLVNCVLKGTQGVAVINGHLSTPIPLPYVHLLSLLVKTYCLMIAVLLGMVWSTDMSHYFNIIKTFLLPFLFNSLLCINDVLSDPFGGDIADFPISKYQQGMKADCESFIDAGDNLPDLLEEKRRSASS